MFAKTEKPLAERLRPKELDQVLGQEGIWAKGALLRTLVEQDKFFSVVFWGPPGTGKTSVAHLIGKHSGRKLSFLSAVHAGVKDIRAVLEQSQSEQEMGLAGRILFLDEIHRLSKNQQDTLLPALEAGTIKFIGATTENPSFEVNNAIISRSLVFRFEQISQEAMVAILQRAVTFLREAGSDIAVDPVVIQTIAQNAQGDARKAITLLDAVLSLSESGTCGLAELAKIRDSLTFFYDKKADDHYDTASAMIKSIRAGDPDAAVYYLARMLSGGEDPMFIARRLVISASEDIGNANPHGLLVASSAAQAVHMVGMPEARIILAQACTFLACSPKSNRAYVAINSALEEVQKSGNLPIPMFLRNAPTELMKKFGYGKGYVYAHDDPQGAQQLCYLPEVLQGKKFYEPSQQGYEANLRRRGPSETSG